MSDSPDGRMAFIGAGNMAEALVNGVLNAGIVPADRITVTDVLQERLDYFRARYGVKGSTDNGEAVQGADVIVLAVKPQILAEVLAGLKSELPGNALVISIAAGVKAATIEAGLEAGQHVVRVMPNTPCLVGRGASAIAPGAHANEQDLATARKLLEAVGVAVEVDESDLDAVTALSGSGPAYIFYFIEAMLAAGREFGLDDAKARLLVTETVEGAARLVAESGDDPAELRRRVTSKGGTTERALGVFDDGNVREILNQAIHAAFQRSKELAGM
jgi:pyrroline-5-carboxylate reductase